MPATLLHTILFVLGFVVIVFGSNLFLDSAIWIARVSGLSQLVIGATIVSICTTVPEVVSSATAALKGAADMALGNAIGSVICNTTLILGVVLLFTVAKVCKERFLVKGSALLVALFAAGAVTIPWNRSFFRTFLTGGTQVFKIGRTEGIILLCCALIYLVVNYIEAKHERANEGDDAPERPAASGRDWLVNILRFGAGAAMVGIGAYLLIEYGQQLARRFGMSEAVISLVFVAFGTSLPELFTAITALRKKAQDISVGNILGANVLNIFLVTGLAGTLSPLRFKDSWLIRFDIPFAFLVTLCLFAVGLKTGRVGRAVGIGLLVAYVVYLSSLVLMGRVGA
jgi:cation:H+ antiporter